MKPIITSRPLCYKLMYTHVLHKFSKAVFLAKLMVYNRVLCNGLSFLAVSLDQTVPEENLPVCANHTLRYTCSVNTGILLWQYAEFTAVFFDSSDMNNGVNLGPFVLKLTLVNGSSLTSTATSSETFSSYKNTRLIVYDGDTFLARDVTVSGTVRVQFGLCMYVVMHHL